MDRYTKQEMIQPPKGNVRLKESEKLRADLAAFRAQGGEIKTIESGTTGYVTVSMSSDIAKQRTIEITMKRRQIRAAAAEKAKAELNNQKRDK